MKPKITRFDIEHWQGMIVIRKWYAGWQIGQVNDEYEEKTLEYDMEPVLKWAEDHGWDVRRWPGGARAFAPGTLAPVRTKAQIIRTRNRLEDVAYRYGGTHPAYGNLSTIDLAYEL